MAGVRCIHGKNKIEFVLILPHNRSRDQVRLITGM